MPGAALLNRTITNANPATTAREALTAAGSRTTVAPYSLRARQSPTVSTPVSWDEVAACRRPQELFFTAGPVLDRVALHGDLFAPLLRLPLADQQQRVRGQGGVAGDR
jgi:bifunctional non-homologous end joining protein LigD